MYMLLVKKNLVRIIIRRKFVEKKRKQLIEKNKCGNVNYQSLGVSLLFSDAKGPLTGELTASVPLSSGLLVDSKMSILFCRLF